jgi:surfactin synthase thioesterase subunit
MTGRAPYPVDAFYGIGDPLVARAEVAAWSQHVDAEFTLHGVEGGHFFQLGAHAADFAATVEALLVQPAVRGARAS